MVRFTSRTMVALCSLIAFQAGAATPAETPELPLRFSANVMIVGGPKAGSARVRFTIERWTTPDERESFLKALDSGGVTALVAAMEKSTVGYMQVNDNLRYPLRLATMWATPDGLSYRVATNRPIAVAEFWSGSRSVDYPIGVAEFSLPPEGKGAGRLLAATKVRFDDQRRLEITSLPQNTGPQQLVNVRQEKHKSKKAKK